MFVLTTLRLLLLVGFVAVGIEDARTRWIPRWWWTPILATALFALTVEAATASSSLWLLRLALSLAVCLPMAGLCWALPSVGNADAKALATLAVAFPSPPVAAPYLSPLVPFSLTVVVNALVVGAVAVAVARLAPRDWLADGVPYLSLLAAGALVGVLVGDVAVLVRSLA